MRTPLYAATLIHSCSFRSDPQDVVESMLELAPVTRQDIVYDLGCGDGRIVITPAPKYRARGVGVDIEPYWATEFTN